MNPDLDKPRELYTCKNCNGHGHFKLEPTYRYDRILFFRRRMITHPRKLCEKCLGDGSVDWIEQIVGKNRRGSYQVRDWSNVEVNYYIFNENKDSRFINHIYIRLNKIQYLIYYTFTIRRKLYSWRTILKDPFNCKGTSSKPKG